MPLVQIEETATPRDLHLLLVQTVGFSKRGFVAMGHILRELKKKDTFKMAVGHGADTWADYLRQPEIGLSASEANRLIQIYEEFVIRLGYDEETISEVPVKNMAYLLPLAKKAKDKDEVDELLADATILSQKDFREKIYEVKLEASGGALGRTYEYLLMRKTVETGTLERVMEISSDTIKTTFNL